MAHYKRTHSTSRKEIKRIDNKKQRSAESQALNGGPVRVVRFDRWGIRPDQPPILDEAPRRPAKKNRRKWCKGRKGIPHEPAVKTTQYSPYVDGSHWGCKNCGKRLWGHKSPQTVSDRTPDHWAIMNIQRRLAGHSCLCAGCTAT